MKSKLFSFGIITYLKFEGVYETLDSLFQQDYPEIELIISDDGSPNYYQEIEKIKEYVEKNKSNNIVSTLYLHLEENQGTVCNVNNALKHASGEFIKLLGAEDVLCRKDTLLQYVQFLEKEKCDIVFAKLEGITSQGERVRYLASCEDDYALLAQMTPEELANKLYARNCLPAPAWGARRKLFDENGLFLATTRLIEDYPYWLHLCRNKVKIGFMDEVLIHYRLSGISSTGSYGISFMEDMYKIYEQCIFPYDKRFGIFQPIYNGLKKMGLDAYYAKAKWGNYTLVEKIVAYIKYGMFFLYIFLNETKMNIKNKILKYI